MRAAGFRNPLADAALTVVYQARSVFANDSSVGSDIYISHPDLLQIERQKLKSMGINAAQVCGHERLSDQLRFRVWHLSRDQKFVRKASEDLGRICHERFISIVSGRRTSTTR
jgi:hypothetical protein